MFWFSIFLFYVVYSQKTSDSSNWIDIYEFPYESPGASVSAAAAGQAMDLDDANTISRLLSSSFESIMNTDEANKFIVLDSGRMRNILSSLNPKSEGESLIHRLHRFRLLMNDPDLIVVGNRTFCEQCNQDKQASSFSIPSYVRTAVEIGVLILLCDLTLLSNKISFGRQIRTLFASTFIISVCWNWYNLYLKALAKNRADVLSRKLTSIIPGSECDRDSESLAKMASRAFRSIFFYGGGGDDECLKYHESLIVSPISEVSPTQALSYTIVKFFIEPAHLFGKAVAELVAGSCHNVPVFMQPVTILISLLTLLFAVLVLSGYSIRIPFFLSLDKPSKQLIYHRHHIGRKFLHRKALEDKTLVQYRKKRRSRKAVEIKDISSSNGNNKYSSFSSDDCA